jgi:hypothetical protein
LLSCLGFFLPIYWGLQYQKGIPINQPVKWNDRGILNTAHMKLWGTTKKWVDVHHHRINWSLQNNESLSWLIRMWELIMLHEILTFWRWHKIAISWGEPYLSSFSETSKLHVFEEYPPPVQLGWLSFTHVYNSLQVLCVHHRDTTNVSWYIFGHLGWHNQ